MQTQAMRGARFVDPRILARIGNLDLLARSVVDGFINGLHRAPYFGASIDFAEHRGYVPGDDIRRVDWRLYARTDRYYVKQYEADTNTNVSILFDISRSMQFTPGPIFANIVLADEVNRTPPKTQAALLEAMQEHRVTIQGRTYTLDEPFFVFATQNPIELEGTYPLPEAQLDRFMFHIIIDHPPEDEEFEVVRTTTAILEPQFERTVTGPDLIAFQRLVRRVPVAEPVLRYALSLVRTSRPKAKNAPESVKKWVAFGASVRAAQYLVLGAKARALTSGRYHVSFEDIRALAHPVMRHRVLTNFRAESEGITTDSIIDELLSAVPTPKSGM